MTLRVVFVTSSEVPTLNDVPTFARGFVGSFRWWHNVTVGLVAKSHPPVQYPEPAFQPELQLSRQISISHRSAVPLSSIID